MMRGKIFIILDLIVWPICSGGSFLLNAAGWLHAGDNWACLRPPVWWAGLFCCFGDIVSLIYQYIK
jgi:hypothetical protein